MPQAVGLMHLFDGLSTSLDTAGQAAQSVAMNVQRAESPAVPAYPERKEFLRQRKLLGAAALGAGMVMSACNPPQSRTTGVPYPPTHLGGVSPAGPTGRFATPPNKKPDGPPDRTLGRIQVEPAKLEPRPRLAGGIGVVPKADPPTKKGASHKDGPPRTLGVPPPHPR